MIHVNNHWLGRIVESCRYNVRVNKQQAIKIPEYLYDNYDDNIINSWNKKLYDILLLPNWFQLYDLNISPVLTHWGETNVPQFHKRHFKCIFLNENFLI